MREENLGDDDCVGNVMTTLRQNYKKMKMKKKKKERSSWSFLSIIVRANCMRV